MSPGAVRSAYVGNGEWCKLFIWSLSGQLRGESVDAVLAANVRQVITTIILKRRTLRAPDKMRIFI